MCMSFNWVFELALLSDSEVEGDFAGVRQEPEEGRFMRLDFLMEAE